MSNATPPPPPPDQTGTRMSPADEKLWATLVHLGGIFFGFLPALIGYIVLKDRGPFVRQHTAAALNFQITMAIASIIGAILIFVIVGIFIVIAVGILVVIFSIVAAIKANEGQYYEYPLAFKFIS